MKKQTKRLLILAIVLVACVAAYVAVALITKAAEKKKEAEETAATVYVGDIGDPVELTFNNGTETLSFEKEDDVWYYAADKDLEIENDKVEKIASAIPDLTADYKLDMAEDASAYGLDKPTYTLSATDAEGKTVQINFGDYCGSGDRYAQIVGDDSLYVIPNDLSSDLSKTLEDDFFVSESLPSVTDDQLKAITVTTAKGSLRLERVADKATSDTTATTAADTSDSSNTSDTSDTTTYTWYVVKDGQYIRTDAYTTDAIKNSNNQTEASLYIATLINMVEDYDFDSCIKCLPDQSQLADYGLATPQITVTVEFTDDTDTSGNSTDEQYTIYFGDIYTVETKDTSDTSDSSDTTTEYDIYAALDPSYAVYNMSAETAAGAISVATYCVE